MKLYDYIKEITDITPFINTQAFCGIRINPLKYSRQKFEKDAPFDAKKCDFFEYGYYISDEQKSGNHPLHLAGAFYIQEPSAMSALTALKVEKTDRVLDMCAAPGSKATAIAPLCDMLVANEINSSRCQALISNIERLGIANALVLNSDSKSVGEAFTGYFDKVLVDSPCSGEGMFRKHPDVLDTWTPELVKMCAERSLEVLENASKALKLGGRLVYSTCTYNLEENEKTVLAFLEKHPDFEAVDTGLEFGQKGLLSLDKARRITIADGGEGHFVCAMVRKSEPPFKKIRPLKLKYNFSMLEGITDGAPRFLGCDGRFGTLEFGGNTFAVPDGMPDPQGVRIMRAGVKLGTLVSKTFKPDHHFFMAADPASIKNKVEITKEQVAEFYKGSTLPADSSVKGFCAVTYEGLTVGFGKASGGVVKNHLPKGLRI